MASTCRDLLCKLHSYSCVISWYLSLTVESSLPIIASLFPEYLKLCVLENGWALCSALSKLNGIRDCMVTLPSVHRGSWSITGGGYAVAVT